MASGYSMTIQDARNLLRKLVAAKDETELHKTVAANIMWCDGVFFSELDKLVEFYKTRGDENSAHKLRDLGDHMARLRFMI